jgi:hypothetical protein
LVKYRASKKSGVAKAAFIYCASATDMPVFDALSSLIVTNDEQRNQEPTHLLKQIEFNWAGKEGLFVKLLRLRDTQLAVDLLGDMVPYENSSLGKLEIGPIEWWLEWMMEPDYQEREYWFRHQLGSLFAGYLDDHAWDAFVTEFNKADSKFRRLLLHYVLPYRSELTTEAFSEDAISFLLADLSRKGSLRGFRDHLLSSTATEQFVTERLLPLLPDAKPPLLENLQTVLRQAGSRHGRRYVTE